jgi:hypothetical protein
MNHSYDGYYPFKTKKNAINAVKNGRFKDWGR